MRNFLPKNNENALTVARLCRYNKPRNIFLWQWKDLPAENYIPKKRGKLTRLNRQKQHRGAAVALAVLVLAAVLFFVGGSWLEKRSQKPETRTELPQETAETMEVDGVTYRRRTDLTTILVMGIDHDSEVEAEGSYQGGQADFQRLIVIDSKDKTVRQLKIDRDTMAEVTVLGMLGTPVGTTQMQISLAHGFGDGREESCGYARDAVSRLLARASIFTLP